MVYGVVAEFNPLHNGHKYQLSKIDSGIKIALISPDFVQRGEVSILRQDKKALMALKMGYDIVAAIPSKYAIQNAEIFCSYSVRILDKLKVDYQVFGTENENLEDIYKMIDVLENSDIKKYLKEGMSYNNACKFVLKDLEDVYKSNNILAMEYIKTIRNFDLKIKPLAIKRKKVSYNEKSVKGKYASASHIRELIKQNKDVSSLVAYEDNTEYNINYENKLFSLFKYVIKTKNIDNIYDMTDDIKHKMQKEVKKTNDYFEFLHLMNAKNMSLNRIKRLILNVVLDIKKEDILKDEKINKIKILALNKKGAKYIKNIKEAVVNYKDLDDKIEDRFKALYEYLFFGYKFSNVIYYESE